MNEDLNGWNQALMDILAERRRQDDKWGELNHDFPLWMVILMEEIGEANQAFLSSQFGGSDDGQAGTVEEYREHMRKHTRVELVQCAAVLIAMIESFDRNSTGEVSNENR